MGKAKHHALLVRIEADSTLAPEEIMDAINWHLNITEDTEADVSAIKFTLAVDVTPPRGID